MRTVVPICISFILGALGGGVLVYSTLDGPQEIIPRNFVKGDLIACTVIRVADGDTLTCDGKNGRVRMRIQGLSAAETNGPGKKVVSKEENEQGIRAKKWFEGRILGQKLFCQVMSNGRSHDRIVTSCKDERGDDIAEKIIKAGVARACPAYQGDKYLRFETKVSQELILPDYCIKKK